jgi:hypothetical protein
MARGGRPRYKAPMRTCVVALVLVPFAAAPLRATETLRLPPSGKALPLKGAGGAGKANACASYGPRFVMVEGTGTCVRIGGSISIDTTIRR